MKSARTPQQQTLGPPGPRMTRRRMLAATAGSVALGAASTGCTVVHGDAVAPDQAGLRFSKEPAPGRERTIEMYNIWGGRMGNTWVELADLYESLQDEIGVRVTYAPMSGDIQLRLQTAIAAGTPPDIAFCTPESYPQYAQRGVAAPLDPFIAGESLHQEDFAPAVWEQMTVMGSIYSMPVLVDVNFPLFWNKKVFADADLDPEAPPRTIDELESMSAQILRRESGRVTRAGTVPWDYYGFSNSLFTVGFAFGGTFMSEDNQVVTPDDPAVVDALTWMCDVAAQMGGASRLAVASPSQTLPTIASGTIGMAPMITTDSQNVRQHGDPETVELGSALFPYAEGQGSEGSATWLGGYNLFIPSEAKDPEAAWDFVRFATLSDEGTLSSFEHGQLLPGYLESPAQQRFTEDAGLAIYRKGLLTCRNIRPTIPVAGNYASALDTAVSAAVYGQITPKAAMKRVADEVNAAFDGFRKEQA